MRQILLSISPQIVPNVLTTDMREEEISEVSLATFHVFDKESHAGQRLACGCGGGCCLFARAPSSAFGNDAYSPLPPPPISPAHKHVRKKP